MNITKYMAEQVAAKLVEPITDNVNRLESELGQKAYDIVVYQMPMEIMRAYNKYPNYFSWSSSVRIHNGSQVIEVDMKKSVPRKDCNYYSTALVDPKDSEEIYKLKIDINDEKEKKEKTYNSIVAALLKLRTLKKAKECFPEAYEYLKEYEYKEGTEIALPIDSIMQTINSYKK